MGLGFNFKKSKFRFCFRVLVFAGSLFLLSLPSNAQAPVPPGTLGNPIVNVTFGQGTTRDSLHASDGTTSYTYIPSPGPVSDGDYAVSSDPTSLSTNGGIYNDYGWKTGPDHTGDPNGQMLVINASYTAGVFFTKNVNGLCSGTQYLFSAWVGDLNRV